ncbi:MAG: hypothetical protein IJ297_06440 [Clostridia bacterium]|nr:hypothetical protein [Clostridia bacterium]
MKINLNFDWQFKKANTPFPLSDAQESIKVNNQDFYSDAYNTEDWEKVSIPHCPNAQDSFDSPIRDAGEATLYRGFMFYRKSFSLSDINNKKFLLEFEAVRQSIYLYVNSVFVGYYEAGVAPVGFDITNFVVEGENLIALATDNAAYRECEFVTTETIPGNPPGDLSGVRHQWNQKDFNEVQGGITGNVNLYVKPLVYQTLPLYNNLKTTGTYIYPSDFDLDNNSATINIRAEIRNESSSPANCFLEVKITDGISTYDYESDVVSIPPAIDKGSVFTTVVPFDAYSENPAPTNAESCCVSYITAAFRLNNLIFWSIDNPHLYDVCITLRSDNTHADTQVLTTGFRQVLYDITNGLCINGKKVYLKGYAQRSTNEWAVIGVANDHLTDFDMALVRESGANYIRWMHVTPKPVAIRSGDKYGVVSVCPAGDKEADCSGREWDMRMEAMRDAIIYFRNSPSVIFYEAGNAAISGEHMREMTAIKNLLDPYGYRFMGCRSLTGHDQIKEAEWVGTMVYRYDAHAKRTMDELNHHVPMLETEYKRDESPRRVWDDYSPPFYDYNNKWLGEGARKTDGYDVWDETQEDFARLAASDNDGYAYFYNNRIGSGFNYYSGAAIMVWSDSNMHGRNSGSENCRTTGKVDPVRIKKQAFYALRAMHSQKPVVHILGHWNYPPDTKENYNYTIKEWNGTYWEPTDKTDRRNPKDKTVFVIASESVFSVELFINKKSVGVCSTPSDSYVFAFPHIDITQSGCIEAVGYGKDGEYLTCHKIKTAQEKAKIVLTPITGPQGLIADGSDICFFDVAVTDTFGNICPLSYDRIDFSLIGDGVFLGGYNSGTFDKTSVVHKSYCYAECGTNRVFVRSVPFGKTFTLTATAPGLERASVTINLTPITTRNGFLSHPQQSYAKNTIIYSDTYLGAKRQTVAALKDKDVYTVTVNGYLVHLPSPAYRPDTSTGVLCAIRPVLNALGVNYTYSHEEKDALTLTDCGATLIEGETAIHINGETNLTNAEFFVECGELVAELSAVLAYVPNIDVVTDSTKKEVSIN